MSDEASDRVSRKRYQREQSARSEAETLLEEKSRALFLANQQLSKHSMLLEKAVVDRTVELQLALERAEAESTARGRFVATMSHEIRTPLGGLLGMIDLLGFDENDPAKKELLGYAKSAGQGLNRIVNDVLDFSKMEAGVFVFEEEHVDIRALIDSICKLSETNPKGGDRPITVKVHKNVPKIFLGDATRVRQVISNLVSNALRYSVHGPIIVRVNTSEHPMGVLLRVEVEDFGVGIADKGVENLFKDFSQVSNSLTAAARGAGLGLAICKQILEGCGGEVGVASVLGEGSTFWFQLPIAIVAKEDWVGAENIPPDGPIRQSLIGKRVLIVEDNIIIQKLLLTYVERLKMLPVLAENGRIAIDLFAPDKFDLVLMDVAMPEIDGLEATRRIREKWAGAVMPPILALTAHVMEAIEEKAMLVGIDVVLSKPIPYVDLKYALETALGSTSNQTQDFDSKSLEVGRLATAQTLIDAMSPTIAKDLLEMFTIEDLTDLAKNYVADAFERIEKIESALDAGDHLSATQQAHSIKGSSMVFGFQEIANCAYVIEQSRPDIDPETITRTIADMKSKLLDLESIV